MMEYYMTWRVAGAVYHVERQIADGNLVAIIQPAIWFENRSINSIAAAVFPQPGNPEAIRLMRAFYGHPEFIRQRAGFSAMEIGRAPVCTQVTTAHLVCRLLLEKKNHITLYTN